MFAVRSDNDVGYLGDQDILGERLMEPELGSLQRGIPLRTRLRNGTLLSRWCDAYWAVRKRNTIRKFRLESNSDKNILIMEAVWRHFDVLSAKDWNNRVAPYDNKSKLWQRQHSTFSDWLYSQSQVKVILLISIRNVECFCARILNVMSVELSDTKLIGRKAWIWIMTKDKQITRIIIPSYHTEAILHGEAGEEKVRDKSVNNMDKMAGTSHPCAGTKIRNFRQLLISRTKYSSVLSCAIQAEGTTTGICDIQEWQGVSPACTSTTARRAIFAGPA